MNKALSNRAKRAMMMIAMRTSPQRRILASAFSSRKANSSYQLTMSPRWPETRKIEKNVDRSVL